MMARMQWTCYLRDHKPFSKEDACKIFASMMCALPKASLLAFKKYMMNFALTL